MAKEMTDSKKPKILQLDNCKQSQQKRLGETTSFAPLSGKLCNSCSQLRGSPNWGRILKNEV